MMQSKEKVEVDICPTHDLIVGDKVNLNFPNTPTCDDCGEQLEKAGMATMEEVETHQ